MRNVDELPRWARRCLEIRGWRGWSQARLASELGVSVRAVVYWERGTTRPQQLVRPILRQLWKDSRPAGVGKTATTNGGENAEG